MTQLKLTEAQIARAVRAAKREGCKMVEIRSDAIRIYIEAPAQEVASELGPKSWDEREIKPIDLVDMSK